MDRSGRPTDFLSANHKYEVQLESFILPKDSSFQSVLSRRNSSEDLHSRPYAGSDHEFEYTDENVGDDVPLNSFTRSWEQPDLQLRLSGPSASQALQLSLCTQNDHELPASSDQRTYRRGTPYLGNSNQGLETVIAHVRRLENASGRGSASESTGQRTDSLLLQWISGRLEEWKRHINGLPIEGTLSQHLHNIVIALTQIEEEVKLLRGNLLGSSSTAGPGYDDGVRNCVAEGECDFEELRSVAQIFHVSSNTYLFCFEQLCHYMGELSAWILETVTPDYVVFWHHERDENGSLMENPDVCSVLPHTDIARLRCGEAHKFVNSVNKVEGETIFRVQTVLIRESTNEWTGFD